MYLDYAATTPLKPQVKQYIIELLDNFQNPSSLYQSGVDVKQIIKQSRQRIANFIKADSQCIYFTSSGSSSNTLAIQGYCSLNNCIIYYSPLLHKSALKCIESLNMINKECIPVDNYGNLDIQFIKNKMSLMKYKPFIIFEYANSEIGTIQRAKELIQLAHDWGGVSYVDCTGSISTSPINVKDLDADMIGFSAHKLQALKGCGVLYKKQNINLEPLVYGSQESGLFGGTENILGIASLGKSVENYDYSSISSENRNYVYEYILKNIPDSYLVGAPIEENRLPHNLYICFKGIQGEALMTLLDMNDIQVSTGSACMSGSLQPSTTLVAIGMDKEDVHSCIRLSFGDNDIPKEELDYVCEKIKECVEQLRRFSQ